MSVNEDARDGAAGCCEGGDTSGGSDCCSGGSAGGGSGSSGGGKVWKTIIFVVVILAAVAVAGHSLLIKNGKTTCSIDKLEASSGAAKECCPFADAAATDCDKDKGSVGCDGKQSLPCSK